MSLQDLGYSTSFQQNFERLGEPGDVPARVLRRDRHGCLLHDGTGEREARVAGRNRDDPPVTGDWVVARPGEPWTVRAVLPRAARFTRASPDGREQVVAANVDVVLLVMGLDADFNIRRLERYLLLASEGGANAVIVLNKADLAEDAPARLAETRAAAPSRDIVVVSAATGAGLDALRPHLAGGRTVALLGSSGVGKSTLANALLGRDVAPTAGLRADGRGKHTTTAGELHRGPDGLLLLDTPGMKELSLWSDGSGLDAAFEDIAAFALHCRFRDCRHETEPGCAVRAAVSPERLASYRKLEREAARASQRVAEAREASRRVGRAHRDVQGDKRRAKEW